MESCPICPINEILQNEPEWGQIQNSGVKSKIEIKRGLDNGLTRFKVMGVELWFISWVMN